MSAGSKTPRVPPQMINLETEVRKGVSDNVESVKLIEKILTLDEGSAKRIVGKTSKSGYRRVHEIVATVLDRVAELERIKASKEQISELLLKITSAMVMVRWQMAREQLSEGLGGALMVMFQEVQRELIGGNIQEAVKKVKRARRIIDSLAVLVYEYSK